MFRPASLPDMLESVNRIRAISSHLLFSAQSEQEVLIPVLVDIFLQKEVTVLKIRNLIFTFQPEILQDRLRSTLRSGHVSGHGNKYCRVLGNIRYERPCIPISEI